MGRSDAGTVLSRLDYSPSGRPGDVKAAFRRGAVGAVAAAAREEAEAQAQALFYYDLAVRNAQVGATTRLAVARATGLAHAIDCIEIEKLDWFDLRML